MKALLIVSLAIPLVSGCANKEKYKLAEEKVKAAKEMYIARQNTLRMDSISKASIAKASMGIVSVDHEPIKKKEAKPEEIKKDCSAIEKDFLEKCDKSFGSGDTDIALEEVCVAWRKKIDKEIEECEAAPVVDDKSEEYVGEEYAEDTDDGSFLSKAFESAESEGAGSVVINQFIGDNNVGQRNNTSSGVGSQTIYNGGGGQAEGIDPEAAAILNLANTDPDSDLKEGGEIFNNTLEAATKIAPYAAGAAVADFVVDGYKEGMREAGPNLENSMNPDQSDRSIKNFAPPPIEESTEAVEVE